MAEPGLGVGLDREGFPTDLTEAGGPMTPEMLRKGQAVLRAACEVGSYDGRDGIRWYVRPRERGKAELACGSEEEK